MVSLRKREKSASLTYLTNRTSKIPLVLDPSDFRLHLERAVRKLDECLFNPRSVILTSAKDGNIDVTALHIDEINTVYYSQDSVSNLLGGMDLGIGIMPLLSAQMMPLSSLESIIDYLLLKNVYNSIQRKMMNTWDYTLLPMNVDGKQFLQVKNPGNLFWMEFLPYIDPAQDMWELYENEYMFLLELAYCYICHANVEIASQVSILGVGKEAAALTNYWEQKIDKVIKEFNDSSLISYAG